MQALCNLKCRTSGSRTAQPLRKKRLKEMGWNWFSTSTPSSPVPAPRPRTRAPKPDPVGPLFEQYVDALKAHIRDLEAQVKSQQELISYLSDAKFFKVPVVPARPSEPYISG